MPFADGIDSVVANRSRNRVSAGRDVEQIEELIFCFQARVESIFRDFRCGHGLPAAPATSGHFLAIDAGNESSRLVVKLELQRF